MKILINTPDLLLPGGVANHYRGLKLYWTHNVVYNYVGGRSGISGSIIIIFDLLKFFFICFLGKYDLIILNPSLGKTALLRDFHYLKIAKFLDNKVVMFFHGWDPSMIDVINQNKLLFKHKFNKADGFFVLSTSFKSDLKLWGITKPIILTSTKVDDRLIKKFDINKKIYNQKLLFLARIEDAKGIFITLNMYKIIKEKYPDATLTIAGSGSKLTEAKKYVVEHGINSVLFENYVSGSQLINVFQECSIYILPSYHEGMPTSILEAMAFGLPIITRPVGGIVDFFENDKMGWMIDSFNPVDFVKPVEELFNNESKFRQIGHSNHNFAVKHFLASEVAKKMEKIINEKFS